MKGTQAQLSSYEKKEGNAAMKMQRRQKIIEM